MKVKEIEVKVDNVIGIKNREEMEEEEKIWKKRKSREIMI